MKQYFLVFFCVMCGLCLQADETGWITDADQITEEWLVGQGTLTGYTEHVRHFKRLFSKMEVKGLLEFGVGFSTKYFMDHAEKVISVEFVTPGTGPEWIKFCIDLFRNSTNWTPIVYFTGSGLDTSWAPNKYMGADSVYRAAAYQPAHYASYATLDSTFLDDLQSFVELQVSKNVIDVAFVDAGVCIRGDLVQVLFNHVPVIVAHDIAPLDRRHIDDVYGYGRLIIPDNYVEVHVTDGMGTAFWILNEPQYQEVIRDMQAYVAEYKAMVANRKK